MSLQPSSRIAPRPGLRGKRSFEGRGRNEHELDVIETEMLTPSPHSTGARSASIVSNGPARRSTRVAPPSPAKSVAATPKPKAKRDRSVSVALSVASEKSDEEEADDDDNASVTGTKRKARATTPRSAKPPVPKKVKVRVPVLGINPIPSLYPGPLAAFDFPITPFGEPTVAPRRAFVFGNGDFGQHGLGVGDNVLCEIKRPRPQAWFDGKIEVAEDGWEGGIAGLECGGMHTLALDGLGRVWSWGYVLSRALRGTRS